MNKSREYWHLRYSRCAIVFIGISIRYDLKDVSFSFSIIIIIIIVILYYYFDWSSLKIFSFQLKPFNSMYLQKPNTWNREEDRDWKSERNSSILFWNESHWTKYCRMHMPCLIVYFFLFGFCECSSYALSIHLFLSWNCLM